VILPRLRIACREGRPVIERMLDVPQVICGRIESVDPIRTEVVEAPGQEESRRP
jgi:hypothetical protein